MKRNSRVKQQIENTDCCHQSGGCSLDSAPSCLFQGRRHPISFQQYVTPGVKTQRKQQCFVTLHFIQSEATLPLVASNRGGRYATDTYRERWTSHVLEREVHSKKHNKKSGQYPIIFKRPDRNGVRFRAFRRNKTTTILKTTVRMDSLLKEASWKHHFWVFTFYSRNN